MKKIKLQFRKEKVASLNEINGLFGGTDNNTGPDTTTDGDQLSKAGGCFSKGQTCKSKVKVFTQCVDGVPATDPTNGTIDPNLTQVNC